MPNLGHLIRPTYVIVAVCRKYINILFAYSSSMDSPGAQRRKVEDASSMMHVLVKYRTPRILGVAMRQCGTLKSTAVRKFAIHLHFTAVLQKTSLRALIESILSSWGVKLLLRSKRRLRPAAVYPSSDFRWPPGPSLMTLECRSAPPTVRTVQM